MRTSAPVHPPVFHGQGGLAGELGGKYFVRRPTLHPKGRTPPEIAEARVRKLAGAIRKADPDRLITVGVIPWAMVWPNAKPVFYSPEVARHLEPGNARTEVMIPIRQLLNRIRWDAQFGKGEFRIGYHDRLQQTLVWVEYRDLRFPADAHGLFELRDEEGRSRRIPFHRVRDVVKDGESIWRRPERGGKPAGGRVGRNCKGDG